MTGISAIFSGMKRVANVLPDLVLGNGAETAGKAIRTTIKNNGSIFNAAKEGVKATEKLSIAADGSKVGFFTRVTNNIGMIKSMPLKYIRAAKISGKGIFGQTFAGIKGFFKGVGKNMPLIGALMTVAFEIPNVVKASKEQGIGQGVKETVKAGARLCGGGLGAAIGSAICPGIGTMIGWMAGEWLTSKIVGKSYSEKIAEAEYEAQEQQALQQQQQVQQQQQLTQQEPVTQPTFQGNVPYQQEQSAVTNPFVQTGLNNNIEDMPNYTNGNLEFTTGNYSNDIFAQNIDFYQLAQNMTNNTAVQNNTPTMHQQLGQPLQLQQPQVSIITP